MTKNSEIEPLREAIKDIIDTYHMNTIEPEGCYTPVNTGEMEQALERAEKLLSATRQERSGLRVEFPSREIISEELERAEKVYKKLWDENKTFAYKYDYLADAVLKILNVNQIAMKDNLYIKFPEKKEIHVQCSGHSYTDNTAISWNACIDEMKKLNSSSAIRTVPNEGLNISTDYLESIMDKHAVKGVNKDGDKISSLPCGNFCLVAEDILSALENKR